MKNKGYLLVLGTALISGFSIFVNKFGVEVFNPYFFTFLKNSLVALFLCSILLVYWDFASFKKIRKKQWAILVLVGLIGGGIPFLLFFKGLSLTTAAGASFIQKTMFLWIFLMAWFFLKEKITKKMIIAALIILTANLFLLNIADFSLDKGMMLILLATIFWSIENVISKYILKEVNPRIVMWSRMFFGSVFILFFLIYSGQISLISQLNYNQVGWVIITGVFLLGYVVTWYSGLSRIKVSEAAIILMLGSPITTLLSSVFIQPVSAREYAAIMMIVLAVGVAFGFDKIFSRLKQFYVRS